eukprot:Ihof_evm4s170 gene=Ihof_evmTU4s170
MGPKFLLFVTTLCCMSLVNVYAKNPECIYTPKTRPRFNPSIMIPMYTWASVDENGKCNHKMFLEVAKGCNSTIAIINPNNGPHVSSDEAPVYKACLTMLSEMGVEMVGYITTKVTTRDPVTGLWSVSGMRPVWQVAEDMEKWVKLAHEIPNFTGFFLDDTSNYFAIQTHLYNINQLWWYRNLVSMARRIMPNSKVVLNPGGFTDVRLMEADPQNGYPVAADMVVAFENYSRFWTPPSSDCLLIEWTKDYGTFGVGPWCGIVPIADQAGHFLNAVAEQSFQTAAMIHTGSEDFAFTQGLAAMLNGIQFFFATERTLDQNPWNQTPVFWEKYLQKLNNDQMKSPRHTSLQRWNDRSASDPPTLLLKKRGLGGSSESTPGRHERLDSNKVILYHPVEEGDTLSGLTIRYNISTAEIKKTNNMWQDGDLHTRKWIKIPIPKYGILTEIKADKLCPPMTRSNSLGSKSVVDMQTAESPVQISNKLLDDVDEEIRVARTNMERIISANHKSQVTLTMAP